MQPYFPEPEMLDRGPGKSKTASFFIQPPNHSHSTVSHIYVQVDVKCSVLVFLVTGPLLLEKFLHYSFYTFSIYTYISRTVL
jgi:hypothetical protein